MAKKKMNRAERATEQIRKLIPKGMIPDSYIDFVVQDNAQFTESYDEMMADIKMQLFEESGIELPMSRKEAEAYLIGDLNDVQWESISDENVTLTSHVKMMEDALDKTMLEMLHEMPLIPASRMISSIIVNYLHSHGQEIDPEREEDIFEDMIHTLNTSFSAMTMERMEEIFAGMEDDDETDGDWDTDLGIEFDWDGVEDASSETGDVPAQDKDHGKSRRRSRITRFPGKK